MSTLKNWIGYQQIKGPNIYSIQICSWQMPNLYEGSFQTEWKYKNKHEK